ncbi:pimeloyl-ACP methyl ester carboxylesterase [Rhodoferax ferrireducens]|uniref:Pimeloyl-ACP methyl ester carboxylesterase n=1 Tax=Rhodoferax ferrireducens TaxID=192843 RepID=A0ABU2C5T3_9BURK|nr:alpha/beta fold hydrolase [Rhodoferax ferrireducens]MDR7376624.1 pimeloyl-ACP methyl ester carboxylesterase [Rhodoferax ferrireducens]
MIDSYISADGVQVRYRDSGGAGPAVLLLHGIGGSLELWSAQLVSDNRAMRLIALDLPGHGLSGFGRQPYAPKTFAAFVWKFVDALGLHKVHLAGNSLGGAICLQMQAQQPARVQTVLLAAAANLGRDCPVPFRLMTLPVLGTLMSRAGPMAVTQQIQAIFGPSFVVTDELRKTIERNVMRPGAQAAFLATLRRMTDLGGQRASLVADAHTALASAPVPPLLLHGRQDSVIPFAHSEHAHKRAPASRFQPIDDCGHTPQLEQPAVFNAALRALVVEA